MKKNFAELIHFVHPWSATALLLAVVALATATAVRVIFAYFGATLFFAPYFPVLLIVSVFAGVPAGIFTAVVSLVIVWWAYMPPYYAFQALSVGEYANFALYAVAAALIIALSHLYRTTVMDLLRSQREKDHLLDELNHRAGNLLTVIQSIVKGTLRNDEISASKLSHRIEALARADDLVSRTPNSAVLLSDLLQRETNPYASLTQIRLAGPDVFLNPKVCRNVALVVHELTTNSVKYGALSQQNGTLDVSWQVLQDRCAISWKENGGPTVREPSRNGFGSRMISASLQTIGGSIDQHFECCGYSCQLSFGVETKRRFNEISG